MQIPTKFGTPPGSNRMESFDNPDYPIYQAFEMRALASNKYSGKDIEEDPLYGSPILLDFIREKLRETLLETPLNYHAMLSVLESAAAACLHNYEENGAESEDNRAALGARSVAMQPSISAAVGEIRSDLNDGIDSLRAGQMELRLAFERNQRSAKDFLPLIESRLGGVYGRLHHTTKQLLALGEYFRSINQAEPDAMNVVVLHQAKACEQELYMRVFGPYLIYLLNEGVMDYLVGGTCKSPLLMQGKDVPRNMALANYCWYLKHDSKLHEWIESTLKLSLPALINEAYWILEQRNLAAHENNYKEYTLAIFRQRLYGRNGLLGCLHTDA